jgi:activating signal cointegrator complex subunit 3
VDISADAGWLDTALSAMALVQSLMQGRWYDADPLLTLPHVAEPEAAQLAAAGLAHLPRLLDALRGAGGERQRAVATLEAAVGKREARDVLAVCERLPVVGVSWQPPRLVAAAPRGEEEGTGEAAGAGDRGGAAAAPSYQLEVELQRLRGKGGGRTAPPRVFAPRFPKASRAVCLGAHWLRRPVCSARAFPAHALLLDASPLGGILEQLMLALLA